MLHKKKTTHLQTEPQSPASQAHKDLRLMGHHKLPSQRTSTWLTPGPSALRTHAHGLCSALTTAVSLAASVFRVYVTMYLEMLVAGDPSKAL